MEVRGEERVKDNARDEADSHTEEGKARFTDFESEENCQQK